MSQASQSQGRGGLWLSRASYAFGNLGQAAFYNALSTYFVTYYAAQLCSANTRSLKLRP